MYRFPIQLVGLSPIKSKSDDLISGPTDSAAAAEGATDDSNKDSTVDAGVSPPVDVDASGSGTKRLSEDESTLEKPKKQFKRRNVALYSALSAEDAA